MAAGTPRIEVIPLERGIRVCPSMMEPGEEVIVAERIAAVFTSARASL